MYFGCANLVRSGCILLSGLLWGLACAKHGLNDNGGSFSLSGNFVRPLWVTFRVVLECRDTSDWAEMFLNDDFRVGHFT